MIEIVFGVSRREGGKSRTNCRCFYVLIKEEGNREALSYYYQ